MADQLVTAPAQEPLSLTEAKQHLRVTQDDENDLIDALIVAARQRAELITRRVLVTQTWKYVTDLWPRAPNPPLFWQVTSQVQFVLPYPPLQSVVSIVYYDTAGAPTTLPSSTYIVDGVSEPGRVALAYNQFWPVTPLQPKNGIVVTYVAGYGAAIAVPQAIKTAIRMMVAHWFENREAFLVAPRAAAVEIPMAVNDLLWGYRLG